MRHDAHYVDELMSRTIHDSPATDRSDAQRRQPHTPPSPDRPDLRGTAAPPLPAVPAAPALALIADRLEALEAHGVARSQASNSPLIAQSVQVEFLRVMRLARAAAALQDREPPLRAELSAREIADAATRASAPIARLAGVDFDVNLDDPAFTILADPALVLQGIAGTVDAIVDLLLADPRRQSASYGRQRPARISISLQTVKVRPAVIIDVVCPTLSVGSSQAERFFDNGADDYRGAPAAGVLLAAAAHIVRAHGGRADVKRHNATGATITYVFPQTT